MCCSEPGAAPQRRDGREREEPGVAPQRHFPLHQVTDQGARGPHPSLQAGSPIHHPPLKWIWFERLNKVL